MSQHPRDDKKLIWNTPNNIWDQFWMIRLHATQMIQMSNSSKPSGVDIWWDEFYGTFLCQSNRRKQNVSPYFCRLSGALLKQEVWKKKGKIMAKTLGWRLARKEESIKWCGDSELEHISPEVYARPEYRGICYANVTFSFTRISGGCVQMFNSW